MKVRGILLIFVVMLSVSVAAQENYKLFELGYVNDRDNSFEFYIQNNKNTALDVKLNVVDTYNLVDASFDSQLFQLQPNEQKSITMNFDINPNLRTSKDNMNYSFYVIPTVINRKDNSILLMNDGVINPINPQSIIFTFNVEKKSFSMLSFLSSISQNLFNIVLVIILLAFLGYFGYQVYGTFTSMKIHMPKIKMPEVHLPKVHMPEIKLPEKKKEDGPKNYQNFVKDFVEKNNAVWTSEQWFKFLTMLQKNDIHKKINEIKQDLEEEREKYVRKHKVHSTEKESESTRTEIDDIRERLKRLKEKF